MWPLAVLVHELDRTGASSSPLAQMEAAPVASALPSKDASTALELDDAGVKPKVPDPSTVFRVAAGGVKIKVEAGVEVEPKPEPCDEDAPAAWDDDDDDCEITPVSGARPFFTTVMSRSQVQKPFQLTIPTRFQRHLPEARAPAVLLRRGRSWATSYRGDLKCRRLDAAWRDFAADNRLRVGDACVFELVEADRALVFRVQVLRGGLPEEVTSRGATPDEPLVIVD